MSDKHPYANVDGALIQLLDQLRKSFPVTVDADFVKKLGIAPKNESYIINVIRFLGLVDEDGKRTEGAHKIFTLHEDNEFQQAFGGVVEKAYDGLFGIYKEGAWEQPDNKLITFFRQTDQSSEIVGSRQARTFKTLAAYAGHVNASASAMKSRPSKPKPAKASAKPSEPKAQRTTSATSRKPPEGEPGVSLTVRIEVNLPAVGDKETYDKIFKSIRENLMNG